MIATSASRDFMTVSELSDEWRCTVQHVYAMIRRGQLPGYRIGNRVIVRRSDALRFLSSNATAKAA